MIYVIYGDDKDTGILKNIRETNMYIFSSSVSFSFPYNLTTGRLVNFDIVFKTRFLKSNINYIGTHNFCYMKTNLSFSCISRR